MAASNVSDGIQSSIERLREAFRGLIVPVDVSWAKELTRLHETWATELAGFARLTEPLNRLFDAFAKDEAKFRRIEAAGWLPHRTTPFSALPAEIGVTDVDGIVGEFYRLNWREVSAAFEKRVTELEIDEEAKSTFLEALSAHERGYYRCVPRLLFPEIERLVREEFFPGELEKTLTSQHDLRKAAGALPAAELSVSALGGLRLYRRLIEHLYERVDTNEKLAMFASDPVPNRHAALHGLVVYRSAKSSLNAIVMTEFAFGVVDLLKRGADELDDEAA